MYVITGIEDELSAISKERLGMHTLVIIHGHWWIANRTAHTYGPSAQLIPYIGNSKIGYHNLSTATTIVVELSHGTTLLNGVLSRLFPQS